MNGSSWSKLSQKMSDILKKLSGSDLRSIGQLDEVIQDTKNDPSLFEDLIYGMLNSDPIIRMRAADAIEKITVENSDLLQPNKSVIIEEAALIDQQEVRWHIAQIIPRLDLNARERVEIVEILKQYLKDNSKIVKTFSMQALADLTKKDKSLRPNVIAIIKESIENRSPAMVSRGKRLLVEL